MNKLQIIESLNLIFNEGKVWDKVKKVWKDHKGKIIAGAALAAGVAGVASGVAYKNMNKSSKKETRDEAYKKKEDDKLERWNQAVDDRINQLRDEKPGDPWTIKPNAMAIKKDNKEHLKNINNYAKHVGNERGKKFQLGYKYNDGKG